MWSMLDVLIATINVYRKEFANRAAQDLPWKGTYTHPTLGDFHRTASASEQWNGSGVLQALKKRVVDTDTGQVVEAVLLEVLQDVLPAVGDGMTSSKWKAKGLEVHGIDPAKYRDLKWGQASPSRGPARR